jgi:2-keto-4-pentenoate hydratase/2-oxohepta-3-ene-1,7-dioic acid hydratase in catechol pathway
LDFGLRIDQGKHTRSEIRNQQSEIREANSMVIVRYQSQTGPAYGLVENHIVYALEGDVFGQFHTGLKIGALEDVKLLTPVTPGKIVALGRNYAEHAREHGADVPTQPLLFLKAPSAVIGPDEPIVLTLLSRRVEHECELVLVIGKRARNVPEEKAWEYVLGVTCGNDVTARDLQKSDGQWARAKSFDTFCPLGPWIVTHLRPKEICDSGITCRVNGATRQMASTREMLFPPAQLIAYITAAMTLLPGDMIMTGTPAGVGPLKAGDVVEVEVEGIGVLRNPVIAP